MRNVQATAAEKADCQCKVPCTYVYIISFN